jgi:hypothetical protein
MRALPRALHDLPLHIGLADFTVEVDTKYIQGMINNPDQQPNMTINHWIAGILLFTFMLCHVSADKHAGLDGLSRRPPTADDPCLDDNHEEWLDDAYSFAVALLNDRDPPLSTPYLSSDKSLPPMTSCFLAPADIDQHETQTHVSPSDIDLHETQIPCS